MCQRKQWEINFEVKRIEVYTFVMKPDDCGYSPEVNIQNRQIGLWGMWAVSYVFQIIFLLF